MGLEVGFDSRFIHIQRLGIKQGPFAEGMPPFKPREIGQELHQALCR